MSKKKNSGLTCAENEAVDLKVVMSENTLEIQLAEYVWSVFQLPMHFENKVEASDFISSKIEGTKYLSARGEQRKMSQLASNFFEYYKELPQNDSCLKELWQIQKIFTKYRKDLFGICQLAMFLGIEPSEFENPTLPQKTQQQLFDEKVKELHRKGVGYNQIARTLGVSSRTVCKIFAEKRVKSNKPRKKSGAKKKDWGKIDRELLPKVEQTVDRLYGTGTERPKRIQVAMIQGKKLNEESKKHLDEINEQIADREKRYAVYEKKIDKVLAAGKPVAKELAVIRKNAKQLPSILGSEPSVKISEKDFNRLIDMAQASGTLEKLNEIYDRELEHMQGIIDDLMVQVKTWKDKVLQYDKFFNVKGLVEEFKEFVRPKSIKERMEAKQKVVEKQKCEQVVNSTARREKDIAI